MKSQGRDTPRGAIRVFLLDDHELVRRGLRDFIADEPDLEMVGDAATAEEALEAIGSTRPDVAVLDVRLPSGSGIEVCREVRSRWPDVKCLILTSFADDEALVDAVLAGAEGYILKETRASELVDGIRKLASGESLLDPSMTEHVFDRLRARRDPEVALSRQEERILNLIGEGMSNRQIAEELHLAEQTVKNYVSRMLSKLGFERRTQAAIYAQRRARGA